MRTSMRTTSGAILGLSIALLATPLLAHHTVSWYYNVDKLVTLKGVITEIDWVNPHVLFHLDVKQDNGSVVNWSVETAAAYQAPRRGLQKDFTTAGELVSMAVFVSKDGAPKAAMQSITLASTGATATVSMLPNGALR